MICQNTVPNLIQRYMYRAIMLHGAFSVARSVVEHTEQTFLVGEDGTSCDDHMTVS